MRDQRARTSRDCSSESRSATCSRAPIPDYPYTDVLRAIQVSVDSLDATSRARYVALAVLLEEMAAAPPVQQCLWGVDENEAAETAEQFVSLSLAQRDQPVGSIRLHDLQLDYVRAQYPKEDKEALDLIRGAIRLSSNVIATEPGIHRGANRRFWFYGADYTLEAQTAYLNRLRKVTEEELRRFIAGKQRSDPEFSSRPRRNTSGERRKGTARSEFRILEHVGRVRKVGRNYLTRCPSCAECGHDRGGDNLAILIEDPRFYKCWAGCTKEMIRAAVGCPIRVRHSKLTAA